MRLTPVLLLTLSACLPPLEGGGAPATPPPSVPMGPAGAEMSSPEARLFGAAGPRTEVDRFLQAFLPYHFFFNPLEASAAGWNPPEGRLPDMSPEGRRSLADGYRVWLERLEAEYRSGEDDGGWDRILLEGELRGRILQLDSVGGWRRDPTVYLELSAQAIFEPVWAPSLPPTQRLRLLSERGRAVSNLLDQGRRNIPATHPLLAARARRLGSELAGALAQDLDRWMPGVQDGPDAWAARQALDRVRTDLMAFVDGMGEDEEALQPMGAVNLARLLRDGGGLDRPLEPGPDGTVPEDEAGEWVEAQMASARLSLEEARTRALEAARGFDGSRDEEEVVRAPGPRTSGGSSAGVEDAAAILAELRAWIQVAGLLPGDWSIPSSAPLHLPALGRPGAPSRGVLSSGDQLLFLDRPLEVHAAISIGEVGGHPSWEGALLQGPPGSGAVEGALRARVMEPTRRIFPNRLTQSGWPLYARGVLATEGYGLDRGALLLQWRAEARAASAYLAALEYHTGSEEVEALLRFLEEEGWWDQEEAREILARGMADPLRVLEGPAALAVRAMVEALTTGGGQPRAPALVRGAYLESGLPPWAARSLIPVLLGDDS